MCVCGCVSMCVQTCNKTTHVLCKLDSCWPDSVGKRLQKSKKLNPHNFLYMNSSGDFHLPQVVQIQKWRHGKMSVSLISLKQMTHSLPSSMAS